MIKAGRLVALAATGPGAKEAFPNLPLLNEAHPDLDLPVWFGIFGPAGMPKEVANTLNTEINKALQAPEARSRFANFGMHPSPTQIATLDTQIKTDRAKFGPLVKSLGLKAE